MRLLLIFTFVLIYTTLLSARQSSYIEVESSVDTSVITIGDRITYSIVIKRAPDLNIVRPGAGVNLGMFEIKAYDFSEPEEENGNIKERFEFTISVFDTGRFVIPPFPVAYFNEDTTDYQIIQAEPVEIFVRSLLSGEESPELKDVKPPIYLAFNYFFWISMAVVALLLVLIAFFGYRIWKQKKEKGYFFKPPPPPRPAHEVALDALAELYAGDLLERGDYKAFYSKMTEIIRIYIEGRYFVSALEETTAEIMKDMEAHLDSDDLKKELYDLLTVADLVKFAKHVPEQPILEQAKQTAIRFVEETKISYEISESIPVNNEDSNLQKENMNEIVEQK